MKYKNIINFIYNLTNKGIKIYVLNDNIKLKVSENISFSEEDKVFITENKQDIIDILKESNITSELITNVILRNKENTAPLSFSQNRLWFIEQYENGTNAYIIPTLLKLSKNINLLKLKQSIRKVIQKHEVLRTIIQEDSQKNLYQHILTDFRLDIKSVKVLDLTELNNKIENQINTIFDLTQDIPIRATLYELKDRCYLCISVHHIAFDGWSNDILLKDLLDFYLDKESINNLQYKDFSLWQQKYLSGKTLDNLMDFWKKKISGYEQTNLPLDYKRPEKFTYQGKEISFKIDKGTSEELRNLGRKLGVSLYSVLVSGYFLMLKCYTGQDDLILGTPFAGRNSNNTDDIIGFFINSLPLRINIDNNLSIKDFIKNISKNVQEIQLNQDLPFEKLVQEIQIEQDITKQPIFQIMFGVQSFATDWARENEIGSLYIPNNSLYNIARFDITTFIDDSNTELKGVFNYNVSLFDEKTVEGFITTYLYIIKQLHCKDKVRDINYLSHLEYPGTILKYNDTYVEYDKTKTAYQLFEEQAIKTPKNIALIYDEKILTYSKLHDKVTELANYLSGIQSETKIIGLYLERSERTVIAILAILKAGFTYMPIDTELPLGRVKYMLNNANLKVILTEQIFSDKLLDIDVIKIFIENCNEFNNYKNNISSDLMYVIYTSGSTGMPKGVQVTHQNAINFLFDMKNRLALTEEDCFVAVTSTSFDISILEIFIPLISGAKLVIAPKEIVGNPEELIALLDRQRCTILQATPSLWKMLLSIEHEFLKRINALCGGETLNADLLQMFIKNNINLLNLYGPTETTIWSTFANIKDKIIIGKPIQNTQIYILNKDLQILPQNAIGEICIAGDGVSKGYLNNEELNSTNFITISTPDNKKVKVYKTGDLGRWLKDGNLECIGRNDFQVKIRGHRISLDEIEYRLMQHSLVEKAVVLPIKIDGADLRLSAHIVPKKTTTEKSNIKFSLFYFAESQNNNINPYYLFTESAKYADLNNFDAVWIPERHFHKVGGNYPNPSILASYLSAITKNIKLKAGSVVLPLHNPIRVAEDWSVIDNISNGRVCVAFASGWNAKDFVFYPEKYQNRKQIMFEDIKTIQDLWSNKSVCRVDGMNNNFDIKLFPKPIQRKLPIWVTTSSSKETFIEAGKIGANILTHLLGQDEVDLADKIALYRKTLKEFGHNVSDSVITLMLHTFVADTTENALSISLKPFRNYLKSHISLINLSEYAGTQKQTEVEIDQILEVASTKHLKNSTLVGSVEDCLKTINRLINIGIDEFACFIDFGISDEYILEHLQYLNQLKQQSEQMVLNDRKIKDYLKDFLPNYMIPSFVLFHDNFKLTVNGKLDRKWLEEKSKEIFHEYSNITDVQYVAPITELEKTICEIWASILNIKYESMSMLDDFFKLGGHSILAIKLVNTINAKLNLKMTILDLFKHKTAQKLIANLADTQISSSQMLEFYQNNIIDKHELSFAQERLWFIGKYENETNIYNTQLVLKIKPTVSIDTLESSINKIIARHEILRSNIKEDLDGTPHQIILPEYIIKVVTKHISDDNQLHNALTDHVKYIYDLTKECPISVFLNILKDERYLSVVVHHIAFDGISSNIFLNELDELYNNEKNTKLAISIQYKDFAAWQRAYLSGSILDRKIDFWKKKLLNYNELKLPADNPRPNHISYSGYNIDFAVDLELSINLRELAKELQVSLYSVLLTGYYLMLRDFSKQDDITIGVPYSNRHYGNIQDSIGLFVNILPLRITTISSKKIELIIQNIHNEIIASQTYQDMPFEKLVKELNVPKNTSLHPIFQTVFNIGNLENKSNLFEIYKNDKISHEVARFDITVFIDDSDDRIIGIFNYANKLFNKKTIQIFISKYLDILNMMPNKNAIASNIDTIDYFPNIHVKNYSHKINTVQSNPTNNFYRIVSSVLKINETDIKGSDNFFALGGDSILAMKFAIRIKNEMNVTIPLKFIFEAANFEELFCKF